jgi:hypothetical protein
MRNLTDTLWDSTAGSNLHCVWTSVHDEDGADRLVAAWMDLALTACKSCALETTDKIDTARAGLRGHEEEEVHLVAVEH